MKSLLELYRELLSDLGQHCGVSTTRDFETVSRRVEHEGLSFFTITLPNLCKDFERDLDQGRICSQSYLGFKKRRSLPLFLKGFFELVFDSSTGLVRNNCSSAIFAIRQALLAFKKYKAECSIPRTRSALEQYVFTDLEIADASDIMPEYKLEVITRASRILFKPVLSDLEKMLSDDPNLVVPRHGPGTTADRTINNEKYDYCVWTRRLEKYFKACDFLLPSWNAEERFLSIDFKEPGEEPPVRVVTVPKTLKTPRIIAIEPVHMQYVQQGIMELLIPLLESPRMHNSLGFTDQTINRRLAQSSSSTGRLSTLDLSEASDRVSNLFVEAMFAPFPTLSGMIQACRSTRADVPGIGIIPISKFASMGSALCFPVEAMVFLTIAFIAYTDGLTSQSLVRKRSSFLKSVRIYGDDIIVTKELTPKLVCELEGFNLKVNKHKSFWTGKFRESCGGDYYDGQDVKPTYFKVAVPTSTQNVSDVESCVASRNLAYKAGLWKVARFLDSRIERFAPFPTVSETSPVLGRFSFLGSDSQKQCPNLHRPLVKGMVPKRIIPKSEIDGYSALMKHFLKRGFDPFFDKLHLKRSGRPNSSAISVRWAPA